VSLPSALPNFALTSTARPDNDDGRMRDIAAAKRARELDNTPSVSASSTGVASTRNGYIHPSRQLPVDCGANSSSVAPDEGGKEEAGPSSGQDKRRRTKPADALPLCSTPASPLLPAAARRDIPPSVEEFNQVLTELQASRREASELRSRLEQLERRIESLLAASLPAAALSMSSSAVPSPTPVPGCRPPSTAPVTTTQPAETRVDASAPAGATAVPALPAATRNQRPRQYTLAEPKAALLTSLSLSPYSTTDLMLDIRFPPLSISMARGHFPNHATQPANHRMGIVNLLQNANGVQLHPPRVPLFVTRAHGELNNIAELQRSYGPDSREYNYLDGILQAVVSGDEYDPCQHSFADAECVSNWHQLLTLDTRIVSSQHQRKLYIRLALLNPVLTAAVNACVATHMQRVQLALATSVKKQAAATARSGATSPAPSVASTVSSTSAEELSGSNVSRMDEDAESSSESERPFTHLRQGAMHCTVSVSPFKQHYSTCTVSNWPRAHPTELCAGNHHLAAFVKQHAPDVRLVTKQENGMTSGKVTAYCQRRHLSQLVGLNGRVSEEHGIHFPLQLHTTVHVMGAKTCTFCWQPGHGATHCTARASSGGAGQPLSTRPACRQCYSFLHTAEACTSTKARECTLCKKQGHCTSQCAHFFPTQLPLQQYLTPTPIKQQQRTAASGTSRVPARILSSELSSAARPWQTAPTASTAASSTAASQTLDLSAHSQQAALFSEFVTPAQLAATLAPILTALQQILSSRLFTEVATAGRASPQVTTIPVHSLL